jgi:hypothetical protein
MRVAVALFDAPEPCRAALAELARKGFAPPDVAVLTDVAGGLADPPPWLAPTASEGGTAGAAPDAALPDRLEAIGLPRADAAAYAEGVRRGAIFVVVRCPALSVGEASRALASGPAMDMPAAVARWTAAPDASYDWASVPPPRLDTSRGAPDRAREAPA